jgi:predicted enzyme related to lactoylglutathione lyase
MSRIINSRYVLAVRNLKVSTAYYVDVLGFRKESIDAPGWSFLTRDTIRLMLGECPDATPAGELGDHSWYAYWGIDGIDDLYQEFQSRGALLTSAPTNKPWGLREFGMSTPDGHRIVCGQTI